MPIYEYKCSCGHQFEKLTRLNDDTVQICPQCGGEAGKVFSVFQTSRSSGNNSWAGDYPVAPGCGG